MDPRIRIRIYTPKCHGYATLHRCFPKKLFGWQLWWTWPTVTVTARSRRSSQLRPRPAGSVSSLQPLMSNVVLDKFFLMNSLVYRPNLPLAIFVGKPVNICCLFLTPHLPLSTAIVGYKMEILFLVFPGFRPADCTSDRNNLSILILWSEQIQAPNYGWQKIEQSH